MKQEWIEIRGKARPICPICGDPILRNLIVIDGKYYHYGCWKNRSKKMPPWLPLWICMDCNHVTSKPKTVIIEGVKHRSCPKCGGPVKLLRRG
ncbi:MAG: hypothetical protein DRJ60_00120 [Thermoprotei archaeon]|nr:MAG: hypothetical protein DRJ60_00120 [Thermoprotei archaeon]